MTKDIGLTSNMEDYLEVIGQLKKNKGVVRVKDISDLLNVKKPSVTSALSILKEKELITQERYGYIDFTDSGLKLAIEIQDRHDLLTKFLTDILKVDKKVAEQDACRMEHVISAETFDKLVKFVKKIEKND